MKNHLALICVVLFIVTGSMVGALIWRAHSAEHYTIKNLTYERVEPNKAWRSTDTLTFRTADGQQIKYLCPQYIYETMVYGTRYDVSIIDGAVSLPSVRIESVMVSH